MRIADLARQSLRTPIASHNCVLAISPKSYSKEQDLMTATNTLKLASSLVALALTGATATAFATSTVPAPANVVYQDASTPDCDKTPEDPRCKDKKK
jgi:hypothetical protein